MNSSSAMPTSTLTPLELTTTAWNATNMTTTENIAMVDMRNFYIGLALSIFSNCLIGTSYILKKRGLIRVAAKNLGHASDGSYSYLKDWVWWGGLIMMCIGEAANFVAYGFAPATLVTPLGALTVIVAAVLSSKFLRETLNVFGQSGCVLCLIGSTMIVTNAPQERTVTNMYELAHLLVDAGFLIYVILVGIGNSVLIFYCAPRWGRTNPMIYVTITGSMGSLLVMSCKSIAVAGSQLFAGETYVVSFWLTWVSIVLAVFCVTIQMNFLNRALDAFNTAVVTPVLYIIFTTFTLIASALLFKEWGVLGAIAILNIICGFLVIVLAIFLISAFKELKLGWRALVDLVFKHNPDVLHTVAADYEAKQVAEAAERAAVTRTASMTSADSGNHRNSTGSSSESESAVERSAEPSGVNSDGDFTSVALDQASGFANSACVGEPQGPLTAVVAANRSTASQPIDGPSTRMQSQNGSLADSQHLNQRALSLISNPKLDCNSFTSNDQAGLDRSGHKRHNHKRNPVDDFNAQLENSCASNRGLFADQLSSSIVSGSTPFAGTRWISEVYSSERNAQKALKSPFADDAKSPKLSAQV